MNLKAILFYSILIFTAVATACSSTTPSQNAAANANTAVVTNTENPTTANLGGGGGGGGAEVKNSNIPGIPAIPGTEKPVSKDDPTRNAKVEMVKRPAPDNSEITTQLGENMVETRTFKNHAQIAKVEKILDIKANKTIYKVYLRNGQVRELPEGKVSDPMGETGDNIMKALAGGAAQTKPEDKNKGETSDNQKKQ